MVLVPNDFGLVQSDHGLCQGIVIGVSAAPD